MPKTFTRRITTDDGTTEVEDAMGITTAGYLSDTTHSEFTASVAPLRHAGSEMADLLSRYERM